MAPRRPPAHRPSAHRRPSTFIRSAVRRATAVAGAVVVLLALAAGCGPAQESQSITPPLGGPCPVRPIDVVVSVDQWGDLVRQLAGSCATVTSIVSGGAVDPHDYEPTPADAAAMGKTDLIVLNGVGYDEWAQRAIDARSEPPVVLDIGGRFDLPKGADPHLWYSPDIVHRTLADITGALTEASPDAAQFLSDRAAAGETSMGAYFDTIAELRDLFEVSQGGAITYVATEPVFDSMASALGMVDVTPEGYARAVSNGGEPAPGDVGQLLDALAHGDVRVLIVNTQSVGSMTDRLRAQATTHHVPVVEITETTAPGASFQDWQVEQLHALATALGHVS